MYIPCASAMIDGGSAPPPDFPFKQPPRFALDNAGMAGAFGGNEAVSAMTVAHVYKNTPWLGWHNSPGSIHMARRLWMLAASTPLPKARDAESGRVDTDPTLLFDMHNSKKGPKFMAAYSGTIMNQTHQTAALFMKECACSRPKSHVVHGRETQPVQITIAQLNPVPEADMPLTRDPHPNIFSLFPTLSSALACVLCAFCLDWYAFALILYGIIANGISSLVIGSAIFVFTHPAPAEGCPPGDGILISDEDIILLKGDEGAVNSITRGRFSLRFSSERHFKLIKSSALLLFIQFFAQLLLIPQATLPGQLAFLFSLGATGFYNWWLSSTDTEEIQRRLLFNSVLNNPDLYSFTLGTRTTAAAFMLLAFKNPNDDQKSDSPSDPRPQKPNPASVLDELLPNATTVWKEWKGSILKQLDASQPFRFSNDDWELDDLVEEQQKLLETLYKDAETAQKGYQQYLDKLQRVAPPSPSQG